MDKFSDQYEKLDKSKYELLIRRIDKLAKKFYKGEYELVLLPNDDIGISAKLEIKAGSRSLLKRCEPIIIGLKSKDLNSARPYVFPDRKDFPFEHFPHINYAHNNLPQTLCLTRENFVEWFAEHTFDEYIDLVRLWLNDAAISNLIKIADGDFFEPFRAHNAVKVLLRNPLEDDSLERAERSGFIFGDIGKTNDKVYLKSLHGATYQEKGLDVLLFKNKKEITSVWFAKYPTTLTDLLLFIKENNFSFNEGELRKQLEKDTCKVEEIFFRFSFVRPTKVLGKKTCIDYLCFCINKDDYLDNNKDSKVDEISLYDIIDPDFANFLSDTKESIAKKKILVLGCGAIGSKLIYHLYRSGVVNLTICDKDKMLLHNICRHALSSATSMEPKVKLIRDNLSNMFPFSTQGLEIVKEDLLTSLPQMNLNKFDLIIDTTASASVFRCLDHLTAEIETPTVRFALSDAGKVGMLYVKYNSKTYLSDYYMQLIREAISNDDISKWIEKEQSYNYDLVRIGEGCHSNTMVLSDDIISAHTALASNIIRNIFEAEEKNRAYLSFIDVDYVGHMFSDFIDVPDFIKLPCENLRDWSIRIPEDLLKKIRIKAKVSVSKEIGGYLMGCVDEKHQVVYVLDQFTPSDSKRFKSKLSLGVKGWMEYFDKIQNKTSKMLTYLGDWHSHPVGSLSRSETDIATNLEIKEAEVVTKYGAALITNSVETKAYLLEPSDLK